MRIKIGAAAPHFKLKDQDGNEFDSHQCIGKQPLVLFFYPKDHTPGCKAEVCSFRDHYEDFEAHGAKVIGVSSDSEKSHHKFSKRHRLPFLLLSDPSNTVHRLYNVSRQLFGLISKRITFIINAEGIIIEIHDSFMATSHIKQSLNALKLKKNN